MRAETETRIREWETRPTDGGYAGLHALAEAAFSGAITAGEAWLFMLDGRPIGLFGGAMDSFANVVATAYVAPHPALPILFTMKERGGETTARYYTGDTPLAETAETLSSGGFTGYVELSKNVLSGEYYLVYHRGRSIRVAFVGEHDRLLTDDEAGTRANQEVGIYEVTAVALEEIDLPEPTENTTAPETSTSLTSPTDGDRRDESPSSADAGDPTGHVDPDTVDPGDGTASDVTTATTTDAAAPSDVPASSDVDETAVDDSEAVEGAGADAVEAGVVGRDGDSIEADREPGGTTDEATGSGPAASPTGANAGSGSNTPSEAAIGAERAASTGSTDRLVAPTDRWGSVVEEPVEERLAAEQQWRETVRIPSIEPARGDAAGSGPRSEPQDESGTNPALDPRRSTSELEAERRTREAAEAEADRLREEVASLRERLERLETTDGSDGSTNALEPSTEERSESIPPARALSETDLFVRYATAGEVTLETAHSGGADRAAVAENLRLERHTGFDPADVLVGDRPFEAFLVGRIEQRFADWVVGSLPFDIRATGHENGLDRLYDALPEIDRIDFRGAVDTDEEGEPTFDVVFRNRMGEPLIVADCVDSREAVDEQRVASLVTAANAARETQEALAGAMLVTTSFFDPGALETATEATRSGLLGRNARESYVTISRRQGYHLCLVEMRDAFHVRMPEL